MAIIKNLTVFWVKLSADKPEPAFGDGGEKWSLQVRVTDKAQLAEIKALNIKTTPVEEDGKIYHKFSLRKPVLKKDGTRNDPPACVNGKLQKIDPGTIGNGSVVHAQVFQFEFEVKAANGKASKKGISTYLKGIQVVKHKVYVPLPKDDDFGLEETETIEPDDIDETETAKEMPNPSGKDDSEF